MEPVAQYASAAALPDDEVRGAVGDRPAGHRRSGRWLVIGITSLLVLGAGMGAGAALPDDTSELEAAQEQVERVRGQVENLESALATSQDTNAALTGSLDKAEAVGKAARQAAASRQRKLDAREAELDERSAELDSRETELDERELDASEPDESSSEPTGSSSASQFDRAWAVDIASDIVNDVKTVDHRLGDGIAVESAMTLLSGDFPRLLDAGVPPGVDEATYVARLETLESFTDEAADLYASDATEGSARYAVVRQQTGLLFDELNAAVGSNFRLP